MISETKMKLVFRTLGMPKWVNLEETDLKSAGKHKFHEIVEKAPKIGKLIVNGASSPLVQELFKKGRKVAAINYYELFNAKFTEEPIEIPPTRDGQVTLIYEVGKEPIKNYEYSAKLLQGLISKYSQNGLVIIETHLAPSAFNTAYGQDIQNKLSIPLKKEEVWT